MSVSMHGEKGPIYGAPLIESLPIGGACSQAMPARDELVKVAKISQRTVAAYEILTKHYLAFAEGVTTKNEVNRQARLEGSDDWEDFGNVPFYEAVRSLAIETSEKHGTGTWVIEVRCESDPENITTVDVKTTIQAEILNPRLGAE